MARPLRIELAGGLYHVTYRGDGRENIYENDKDRKEWLIVFEKVCERFKGTSINRISLRAPPPSLQIFFKKTSACRVKNH